MWVFTSSHASGYLWLTAGSKLKLLCIDLNSYHAPSKTHERLQLLRSRSNMLDQIQKNFNLTCLLIMPTTHHTYLRIAATRSFLLNLIETTQHLKKINFVFCQKNQVPKTTFNYIYHFTLYSALVVVLSHIPGFSRLSLIQSSTASFNKLVYFKNWIKNWVVAPMVSESEIA